MLSLPSRTLACLGLLVALWSRQVLPAVADSAQEHFHKAIQFRFLGHPDAAVAEYRRGLAIEPDSVDGHAQLGTLLIEEMGDVDGAMSELVTAMGIDPDCRYCQTRLNEVIDLANSKAADQVTRGNKFYQDGHMGRAAAAYRVAIHIDPEDGSAHNSLAWTLYRMGQLDAAMAEVIEALRIRPTDAEYINTLACIYYDKGDIDQALAKFRQAISLSKSPNAADLYGLAIGLLSKGDRASASRYFNDAIKIDPKYLDAKYVSERIGLSVHAVAAHDRLLSLAAKKEKPQVNPER